MVHRFLTVRRTRRMQQTGNRLIAGVPRNFQIRLNFLQVRLNFQVRLNVGYGQDIISLNAPLDELDMHKLFLHSLKFIVGEMRFKRP